MTTPFSRISSNRSVTAVVTLACTVWIGGIQSVHAQTKKVAPRTTKAAAAKFEDITLTTRDGVELHAPTIQVPKARTHRP